MANASLPSVIITVRLIRSFEHRNIKPVIFKDVDLNISVKEFIDFVKVEIKTRPGLLPPFRNYGYDAMKIQHMAHGSKTSDPTINTEDDDKLMMKDDNTLQECGIEHETEISFFKLEDYRKYQSNPVCKW
ncbi:UPF0538 protein C2orf76-like [Anneissia japonica]|uniref:UPF0538 protein C2orf76-like n=1 Tax=Anneissia japonica TaxID=1529436 RepID=UPI0014254E96|nr:UPF0538 protein C2orf76-like [Anneissia japonica]